MLPLHDTNPTSRTAYVTMALIALNVVAFLFEPITAGNADQARFFFCNAAIPAEVTSGEQLEITRQVCPGKSVWLSVLVAMFLHGSLLHIAGNMLFLWVFGNNVEDRLGRVKFAAFYLLCGIAATLAQSWIDSDSAVPMVGASGAVAGVLGAYLLMFPHARVTTLFFYVLMDLPAVVVLAGWFVLQVFQGVGSIRGLDAGVAYFAHIGGFLAGMALLLILRPRRPWAAARPG